MRSTNQDLLIFLLSTGSETQYASLLQIESVTIHPQYNRTTQENDIALIAVRGQIQYNPGVSPVCLPFLYSSTDFQGATVIVLGTSFSYVYQ